MIAVRRNTAGQFRALFALACALALPTWASSASAICLNPPGDVNGNGATTVTDVQCIFLGVLWQVDLAAGQASAPPDCATAGIFRADLDCSGIINVIDTVIGVNLVLGLPLASELDANNNLCVDACESQQAVCGNGIIEAEEQCDDGLANSNTLADFCRTDCTLPRCGDGVVDSGEQCDDANQIAGDGCENNCTISVGSVTVPYSQSFNGATFGAVGWTIQTDAGSPANNWVLATAGPLGPDSHARFFYLPAVSNYEDTLISPVLDASGHSTLTLGFDQHIALNGATASTTFEVLASADAGQTWDVIYSRTGADGPLATTRTVLDVSAVLGGSSAARVAFRIKGPSSSQILYWEVDEVSLTPGAPPVLGFVPTLSIAAGSNNTTTLFASDLDTPASGLTFGVTGAPAWVSITNNNDGTATLSLTPPAIASGTFTGTVLSVTDGTYTATQALLITVVAGTSGTVAYVIIRSAAGGLGTEVGAVSVQVGQPLVLYAAGYNAAGSYTGDVNVVWSSTGSLEPPPAVPSSSLSYVPTLPNTSGLIVATPTAPGAAFDTTGTISVTPPTASGVSLLSSTVSVAPTAINAGSSDTALITVTAINTLGQPMTGATVVIGATAGTLQGTVTEVGDGVYTQSIQAAAEVSSATITATVNGDLLTKTATLQFSTFTSLPAGGSIIDCDNIASFEGRNLLITSLVEINTNPTAANPGGCAPMQFGDIIVTNGGNLVHKATTASIEYFMDIEVTSLVVQPGGSVHADARGYLGAQTTSSNGYTFGNTVVGGAGSGVGGSHGGVGGRGGLASQVYGNFQDPRTLGGGGGRRSDNNTVGLAGGGAIRIKASEQIVVNGSIRVNGGSNSNGGGGAGGSISLETPRLAGSGTLQANGGAGLNSPSGAGGGGRIAVRGVTELTGAFSLSTFAANVRAYGGNQTTIAIAGGAGTVFLRREGEDYGTLIVDNGVTNVYAPVGSTPILVVPPAQSTGLGASSLTNASAQWASNFFVGTHITPNANQPGASGGLSTQSLYRVTNHTATTLTLEGTGDVTDVAEVGDAYRGVLVLDQLDIRGRASVIVNGDVWVRSGSLLSPAVDTFLLSGRLETGWLELTGVQRAELQYGIFAYTTLFKSGATNPALAWQLATSSNITTSTVNATTVSAASSSSVNVGTFTASGTIIGNTSSWTVSSLTANRMELLGSGTYNLGTVNVATDFVCTNVNPQIDSLTTGRDILLQGTSTLTMREPTVTAGRRLQLRNTAQLTHEDTIIGGPIERLHIVTQSVVVESGAAINANGKGFRGVTGVLGYSIGNSTELGAGDNMGGSHGGIGGNANDARVYGSLFEPIHPGAGGARRSNAASTGGNGGGVVRIEASALVRVDGSIQANGVAQTGAGGAGGSVWITTPHLAGTGSILANGSNGTSTGGGGAGGRVAVTGLSLRTGVFIDSNVANAISATGGTGAVRGGAGTVYLKHLSQSFGDLIVDSKGNVSPPRSTPIILVPEGQSGTNNGNLLVNNSAGWAIDRYAGTWVNPNIVQNGPDAPLLGQQIFYVTGNDSTSLSTQGSVPLLDVAPGNNPYRGILPLDRLEVRGRASLDVQGDLLVRFGDISTAEESTNTMVLSGEIFANVVDLNEVFTIVADAGGFQAERIFSLGDATFPLTFEFGAGSILSLPNLIAGNLSGGGATIQVGALQVLGDIELSSSNITASSITVGGTLSLSGGTTSAGAVQAGAISIVGGTHNVDSLSSASDIDLDLAAAVTVHEENVTAAGLLRLQANNTRIHSCATSASKICRLNVSADSLLVGTGAAIDVSTRGFLGSGGVANAYSVGNTLTFGAPIGVGGSHGGIGGGSNATRVYGNFTDPRQPGGGGGRHNTTTTTAGGAGGGVIVLQIGSFTSINGNLLANGAPGGGAGGAGGAINLTTPFLGGQGQISANGGNGNSSQGGSGSGGRISLRGLVALSGGFSLPSLFGKVSAQGGAVGAIGGSANPARGGAGTLYLQRQGQQFGDLIVDNKNVDSGTGYTTPIFVVPQGQITTLGPGNQLKDAVATWTPGLYRGTRVNPNTAQPGNTTGLLTQELYGIIDNTLDTLSLVGAQPIGTIAAVGNTYRGVLAVDNLEIRGRARVEVMGDLLVMQGDLTSNNTATFSTSGAIKASVIDLNLAETISLAQGALEAGALFSHQDPDYEFDWTLVNSTVTVPNVRAGLFDLQGSTVQAGSVVVGGNVVAASGSVINATSLQVSGQTLFDSAGGNIGTLTASQLVEIQGSTIGFGTLTANADVNIRSGSVVEIHETNVVSSGTVRVVGLNTSLRPCKTSTTKVCSLHVQAPAVFVGQSAFIDANGLGFLGATGTTGIAYTLGNVTTGGANANVGGSHGGRGGLGINSQVYDNFIDPVHPGGGGGRRSSNNTAGGDGGGVIRITASVSTVIDGVVRANGLAGSTGAGGAGGTVNIQTGYLSGIGRIEAFGANSGATTVTSGGGGGRVSIRGFSATGGSFSQANLSSNVRIYGGNGIERGGAGTLYLRPLGQTHGTLIVDNFGFAAPAESTPIPVIPQGLTSQVDGDALSITDFSATWPSNRFVGTWLNPHTSQVGSTNGLATQQLFRVSGNTLNTVTVEGNGAAFAALAAPTRQYRGVLRLDQIAVRGSADCFVDGDVLIQSGSYGAPEADTFVLDGALRAHYVDLGTTNRLEFTSGGLYAVEIYANGQANASFDVVLDNATLSEQTIHVGDLVLTSTGVVAANMVIASGDVDVQGGQLTVSQLTAGGTLNLNAIGSSTIGTLQAAELFMHGGTLTAGTIEVSGSAIFGGGANVTITNDDVEVGELFEVKDSGTVFAHAPTTTAETRRLNISADVAVVNTGATINVSGRGYVSVTAGNAYTWPNTVTGGAGERIGGTHGGLGGIGSIAGTAPASFDSIYDPRFPGGAGGRTASTAGGNGGGVVWIEASTAVVVDGSINANGVLGGTSAGAGAGGSIRITTPVLVGAGLISANGGVTNTNAGGGGGGRIAVLGTEAMGGAFAMSNLTNTVAASGIRAVGGTGRLSLRGGAGTIFIQPAGDPHGTLVLNNFNTDSQVNSTPLVSLPTGTVFSLPANNQLLDASAGWATNFFAGTWVNPNVNQAGAPRLKTHQIFPITGNSIQTLTVQGNMSGVTAPAASYRGAYKFTNLEVAGRARLFTPGDIIVTQGDLKSGDTTTFNLPLNCFVTATNLELYAAQPSGAGTINANVLTD